MKMMHIDLKKKRPMYAVEGLVLIAFFLISVIIRYNLSDFPKTIHVYPDELLYYQIAGNIASHGSVEVYHTPTFFQKIAYALVLAPAFYIKDCFLRIRVIALINSVLMSAGIFPVYYMARQTVDSKLNRIALCALYTIASDMTYSMTFMSENLFLPLALLCICAYWTLIDFHGSNKKKYALCVSVGILNYALFMTKDIGLALILAYVLYRLFESVYYAYYNKIETGTILKSGISDVGIIGLSFFTIHFLVKLFAFSGVDSASQTIAYSFQRLFDDGRFRYILYAFTYLFCSTLVAYLVLPIIFPAILFTHMKPRARKKFVFILLILVITVAVIAILISSNEDFNRLLPRTHLRYICHLFLPFMCIFVHSVEKKTSDANIKVMLGVILSIAFFLMWFYRGAFDGSSVDQTMLGYLLRFTEDEVLVYCAVMGLVLSGLTILYKKQTQIFLYLFIAAIMAVQFENNIVAIKRHWKDYAISNNTYENINILMQQLKEKENVLIINDSNDKFQRVIDTYFAERNYYNVNGSSLISIQSETGCDLKDIDIYPTCGWVYQVPYKLDQFDGIVVSSDYKLSDYLESNQHNYNTDEFNYSVYSIDRTSKIPFIREWWDIQEGSNTVFVNTEHFYTQLNLMDNAFASSTETGQLFYGPYRELPPGKYSISFHYNYFGDAKPGTELGIADINSLNMDLSSFYQSFYAGSDKVCINGLVLEEPCPNFELRMFTYEPCVEIKSIIIQREI